MVLSNKKKNILFIIIALIIVIIISSFFLFWPEKYKGPEFKKHVDDFVIEGNIITNEKEGLKVIIPDGWKAEKQEQVFSFLWGVRILSPDAEIELLDSFSDTLVLKKGCAISVRINNGEGDVWYVNETLKSINESVKISLLDADSEIGIMKINNHLGLKKGILDNGMVLLMVPLKNDKLAQFSFVLAKDSKDFCQEEFNGFLRGIKIEK